MRLSGRFTWQSQPNALALAKAERRAAGLPLIDLTISNPTRAGISYPPDLLQPLVDPRTLTYEPEAFGLPAAREAVAAYYRDHGADVSPERIVLTASTSEAYHYLFQLLADPGDEILIPRPSYPLFEYLAGLDWVSTHAYRLGREMPTDLATNRTRAVVAVHPNNPTGKYLRDGAEVAARCEALGMAFLVDEVFLDYRLRSGVMGTLAKLDDRTTFVLSGLSKICGLPQMKLGWMVLPARLEAEARDRLELVADTYLSVSAPVQWAAASWLGRRQEVQAAILERLRANLSLLARSFPGIDVECGWTAVVELPSTVDEEVLALRLLQEAGVLVQPGYFYDFDPAPRLVLSLLTPLDDMERGIAAIAAMLAQEIS